MNLLAFDPGMKGGIAALTGVSTVTATIMPVAGKELDLRQIAEFVIQVQPELIVIEKVGSMPGQGVTSMFTFGKGFGALQGIAAALGIPVELVTPQAWKKVVLAGTAKDKDAAFAYCRRVFPQVSLIPHRCRKPHDGIADALCLLEYGRRTFMRNSQEVA